MGRATCAETKMTRRRLPQWYLSAMERLIRVAQALSLARDMPSLQRTVRSAARKSTGADGATFRTHGDEMSAYQWSRSRVARAAADIN